MKIAALLCLIALFLTQGCTNSETNKTEEQPPSIVYADDDSTVLSFYSNVGKKGPNLAPYFCASLKNDLKDILMQKDGKGNFKYHKKDGSPYDLYSDELKIYTSINPTLQAHAEAAQRKHLTDDLQPAFSENNSSVKHFPFSDTYNHIKIKDKVIEKILDRARKTSSRYRNLRGAGVPDEEIFKSFNVPTQMKVFSWAGEIDTVLTPNDSILYSKNFIRSSVLSIEPSTGNIKAWVGGIDFDHFPDDCIRTQKRQMGTTMKAFLYSTGMSMGVIKPCEELKTEPYCIDPCDPSGRKWCPTGSVHGTIKRNFALSTGRISGSGLVMSRIGSCAGPQTLAKLLERMNFKIPKDQIVPSMCLGTTDASLLQLVAANAMFVNNGVYISPKTVLRIEDKDGNEIYSAKTKSREVLNSTITFEMLQMMKGVVQFGEATTLRSERKWGGIEHPTAAMVGTTRGNSDGWFVGMTPDLVTGVWTGGADTRIRFRTMLWGQGARSALPIYSYFMQRVYADKQLKLSIEDFKPPSSYNPKLFACSEDEMPAPDERVNQFGI